jgi:hypothetical protein
MTIKATNQSSNYARVTMSALSALIILLVSSVTGAYGFAFLPSRRIHASYSPAKTVAADATLKNTQPQTPSFVRRSAPAAVALFAEASSSSLGVGSAKNASEVSHEELRSYRNAMSISRTEGKANGGSDTKVR